MIAFFPEIYEDELVYSQLARYYVKSGYLSLAYALEDLYVHKYTVPDIEFLNEMKPEVMALMNRDLNMDTIIEEHTMFPYYGRFLSKERKRQAFEALTAMHGNFNNLLAIPKNQRGVGKNLCYCPVCAQEDREKYGETYWHRSHQLQGVRICGKHRCYLIETSVSMNRKASPGLYDAETVAKKTENVILCEDGKEIALAEYMLQVFLSRMDFLGTVSAADFIRLKLENYHRSDSGASISLESLYQDYQEFYNGNSIMTRTQIQKVLSGARRNFNDICQLAMFAGISAQELATIPENVQETLREPVFVQVAEELQMDYELVHRIGEAVLRQYEGRERVQRKCGKRIYAWEKMDESLLPEVRDTVKRLRGTGMERPQRITVSSVTKAMGLPDKRFDKLPKCREEIIRYQETQKEYWAREVVWAYKKLIQEGREVSWRQIRSLTNMRKIDFQNCKQFLAQYAGEDIVEQLQGLV